MLRRVPEGGLARHKAQCKLNRKKLRVLAKLSGRDEGFGDDALHFEAMRSLLPLLERAHEADEGLTEEDVLDGVMALGKVCKNIDD